MRTRQEIKAIGKARFKANYWTCVLAVLLMGAVLAVISSLSVGQSYTSVVDSAMYGTEPEAATIGIRTGVGGLLTLLLAGPLAVGLNYFHVMNVLGRTEDLTVITPFRSAFTNYPRKLGGYLWMELFIFLWSLIAGVGGGICGALIALGADSRAGIVLILIGVLVLIAACIVPFMKAYSYAMTPYILADCPNVKAKDALKLSMRIMAGHRWELFVFQLSFIGWYLLSILTLGILNIFFTDPYMYNSLATYYLEVREAALRTGAVTMGQLEGTEAV